MSQRNKILVVEDTERHQQAARLSLAEHNLEICPDYSRAIDSLNEEDFDVLLTDAQIPFDSEYGREKEFGRPQNLGIMVALYGAKRKIPLIGVYSDKNHHHDAFSKTLDYFCPIQVGEEDKDKREINGKEVLPFQKEIYHYAFPVIKVNESKLVFFLDVCPGMTYISRDGSKIGDPDEVLPGLNYTNWKDEDRVKDWGKVLEILESGKD